MTRNEGLEIARVIKRLRPNDETATVGERLLWARLARKVQTFCSNYQASFNAAEWREACALSTDEGDE